MSKVVIEIDTEEASMTVDVDGETFKNVDSVSAYCYTTYDEEDRVGISVTLEPEKTGHLTKRVYISTAETVKAKSAIAEKKAVCVAKDGSIIKFEQSDNISDSIAKVLARTRK